MANCTKGDCRQPEKCGHRQICLVRLTTNCDDDDRKVVGEVIPVCAIQLVGKPVECLRNATGIRWRQVVQISVYEYADDKTDALTRPRPMEVPE